MIQTAQIRQDPTDWVAEPAPAIQSPDRPSATTSLVPLEPGFYALEIAEMTCLSGRVCGLQVPIIQVSAPPCGGDQTVEIIGTSGHREAWLGPEGGTVIIKAPPGGGHALVTAYGLPAQFVPIPETQIRRLDRPRPNGAGLGPIDAGGELAEIATEIVLHVERLGDRRFPGRGWVGNRGKKLRIEAFSIRPMDTLLARDIEFMALGPNRRQTPWVSDAKLCGTRGQGLPLTGFAVRLAPHVGERFDAVYQGAFFESGIIGPKRNGELCIPTIADDPLEAISLRLIQRPAR